MYRGVTRFNFINIHIYNNRCYYINKYYSYRNKHLYFVIYIGITNMEDGKQGSDESPETKISTWGLLVSTFLLCLNYFKPSRTYYNLKSERLSRNLYL